jgi:hypothetical protein
LVLEAKRIVNVRDVASIREQMQRFENVYKPGYEAETRELLRLSEDSISGRTDEHGTVQRPVAMLLECLMDDQRYQLL